MSDTGPGRPYPLGATADPGGVNFALYSADADAVELCLLAVDGTERRIPLPEQTYHVWHGYLPGVAPGQRYGYRVHGRWDPAAGLRFNPNKLLADPYARALVGEVRYGETIYAHDGDPYHGGPDQTDSVRHVPHSVVLGPPPVVARPRPAVSRPAVPWPDTVIYELHVRGFTARHPDLPEPLRGTYAGLAQPAAVEYLRGLGVTTVELLPVHAAVTEPRVAARGLTNYWGYNTLGFFAPDARLAAATDPAAVVEEFRGMVATLHAAGLEVILDVVYNHTCEGDAAGPTLSLRGIDNRTYYRLAPGDPARYTDVTGCGNTLDLRQLATIRLVLDSLRYWVVEMGVDGFRFDLAPALARGADDGFDPRAAFLAAVHADPLLSGVKLIAEPWDLGSDGYQLGGFPPLWTEWNGRFRDTVRDFWRGVPTEPAELGWRLTGSEDLYAGGRRPWASVNFVTAHDGFTLRDLVSYAYKHNEDNGEDNADGTDDNRSDNYGVEGDTDEEGITALRRRQQRNLLTTLLLAAGVPMLLAGDELGRTQHGNNNAYCQDDELSWMDWSRPRGYGPLLGFVRRLVALRRASPVLRQPSFFRGEPRGDSKVKDLAWFRVDGQEMSPEDWWSPATQTVGMYLSGEQVADASYLLWLHSGHSGVDAVLPGAPWAESYQLVLDTAAEDGDPGDRPPLPAGTALHLPDRSAALLRAAGDDRS